MPDPQLPAIVHPESSAVQAYLTMLQGVITRMAGNSSSCKTLCLTLVSAIIVIITTNNKPNLAIGILLPVILLGLLDAYYLGLEQGFRNTYNEFVKKLQNGEATTKDLYVMLPKHAIKKRTSEGTITETQPFSPIRATAIALKSFSIYPFYLTIIVIIVVGSFFVS